VDSQEMSTTAGRAPRENRQRDSGETSEDRGTIEADFFRSQSEVVVELDRQCVQ
jgi:hypothetical protein